MARKAKTLSTIEIQTALTGALRRVALRPTIAGYRPQEHQIPFHESKSKGRLLIGGNRSGKTVSGAAELTMWLTGKHISGCKFPPPIRGRAIGVDFDNGINKIILPEIAKWMPPSALINGSWDDSYHKSMKTLTLTNGSQVEFMSYDQDVDKFSGTSRHCVWFDEEPPEEIFNENMARLVDTGGNWWLTMTPLIDMSWTYDNLYLKGKNGDPNIEVFEVSTLQNEYVNASEMEILFGNLKEDEKKARMYGTYMQHSGTIYGEHMHPPVEGKVGTIIDPIVDGPMWNIYKSRWGHFCMMDHGHANPTCFLWGAFDSEGKIVIYKEYYERKKIVAEHALAIRGINESLGFIPSYYVGDPSIGNTNPITGTSVQIEYSEHGVPILLGNNDVGAGIERVANRFRSKMLYITRDCEYLIWELNRYRWGKYSSKKIAARSNEKEQPLKKDDHAVDALRYGVVSRPALYGENEVQAYSKMGVEKAIEQGILVDAGVNEISSYDTTLGSDC